MGGLVGAIPFIKRKNLVSCNDYNMPSLFSNATKRYPNTTCNKVLFTNNSLNDIQIP